MKGTPGVASRVFGAVASRGVNVRMIAQGSSELNISFVVREEDGVEAVKAIHEDYGAWEERPDTGMNILRAEEPGFKRLKV
jgi:aspartate kinase